MAMPAPSRLSIDDWTTQNRNTAILNEETTMTIEEQLATLTRSVESIAQMQAKTENEIRTLGRYIRAIVLDHEARLLVLEQEDKSEG
jgi:hypothetical protein